jgi:NAD(P)-dependent dehydrogenase (short-subunit alcohol dehydrogenase family)
MGDDVDSIDRCALITRHRVTLTAPHPENVLTVGNGDFGYTADITGMQSFTAYHDAAAAASRGEVAVNTATMSNWGWHEMPNPEGFTLENAMTTYDTARGAVSYADKHDMMGAMTGTVAEEFRAGAWLNANPQRIDLGRVGLELRPTIGAEPESDPSVLGNVEQSLDLWTGSISSSFHYAGEDVRVETVAAPDSSVVAFRISSALLRDGRARVVLRFPYASDGFSQTDDWSAPGRHTSLLHVTGEGEGTIARHLDDTAYLVHASASSGNFEASESPHVFALSGPEAELELVITYSPQQHDQHSARRFSDVASASRDAWREFWQSGAALDLSGSTDRRAAELERRVVLSQYLTRVHCSGRLPPQETGLVTNSWQGKFHLEMHLWHAAHFAVWGRPELLERSLDWYLTVLDDARATAAVQGYPGARWPKQTGPDGRESPSDIGALLVWQQPHILHLLELVWQASDSEHRRRLLDRFGEAIDATATFMAAFAEERNEAFHLGPPIMPAQEFYDAPTTTDPTFELAYWWWGLELAQHWRERAGLERDQSWQAVQDGMAAPLIVDGRYAAVATDAPLRTDDHPSLLMALGLLPPTPVIDPGIMRETLYHVWRDWKWPTAWGWDFPVMAMTASRLGDRELALDALLRDEIKNGYTLVGHNPQMRGILPLYLPGNGSLLLAVALLAQNDGFVVGGWTARAEGFAPFPSGIPFDPSRPQRHQPITTEGRTDRMSAAKALNAKSPIGEWLDDPIGGELVRGLLAASGADADSLAPIKSLPLQQLVTLSQGAMPQSVIDDLVMKANDGVIPDDGESAAWAERITPGRFTGKTVIVTGAASGIGRATASRVAREGGRVIAVDVSAERLAEFESSLPDAEITVFTGDITNQKSVDAIVAAAGERIDALANVAGINDDFSPLHETTDAVWDRVIGVNLTGTFKLTRAVLPAMIAAGGGSIVNVASEAGLRGNASGNAYTVSKHGVVGLTKSAAFMYGPHGIRVNAVAPGGVATGIPFPPSVSQAGSERLHPFQTQIPTVATAEHLAASITFLLSDDGVNVNGAILASDGGWSVQ